MIKSLVSAMTSHRKEFHIPSDLSLIQSTTNDVLSFLKPLDLAEGVVFDIRLCLEEALINAMKYGNRLDPKVPVELVIEYSKDEVRLLIEDKGEGFDPKALLNCTEGDNLLRQSGRGVYLIHQLMDRVKYNSRGNRLLMVKFVRKENKSGTKSA